MKRLALVVLFVWRCFLLNAQVKIYPADSGLYSIENLAKFFIGKGVKILNVKITGNRAAFGQFVDVNGSIGLKKGIILTTGKVTDAIGPNDSENKSTDWYPSVNYEDVNLSDEISGNSVKDVAALEFDFIPITDSIRFRLVYGSELYDKYISNSGGNNYFNPLGIFLKQGAGNFENIATFSGANANEIITVQRINRGYALRDSVPKGVGVNESLYVYNPPNSPNIQYNGYTKAITLKQKVNKCSSYTMKIAIGNSPSFGPDSGVLLEQADFGNAGIYASVPISDSDTIFLCQGDIMPVLTVNGNLANSFQWYFNNTIVRNATTTSFLAIITGEYKVKATISGTCMWTDSIYVKIGTKFPVDLKANPTLVCKNQLVTLTGSFPSSILGQDIAWNSKPFYSFAENQLVQFVSLSDSSNQFKFSVRSQTGCTQEDSVVVIKNPTLFKLDPSLDDTICLNDSKILDARWDGNIVTTPDLFQDPFILVWKNNAGEILSNHKSFTIKPTKSDTYKVNLQSHNGCKDSAKVNIQVDSVVFARISDRSICPNETIFLTTTGYNNSYIWRQRGDLVTLSGDFIAVSPKTSTGYFLEVVGDNGCKGYDTTEISIVPPPTYLKSNDTIVCKGNDAILSVKNADSLVWNNINQTNNSFIYRANNAKNFRFTVFADGKCAKTDSIAVKLFPDFVNTISGANAVCIGDSISLKASGTVQNLWVNSGKTSAQIFIRPSENTTCTFIGTNLNKCRDTTILPIKVNRVPIDKPNLISAAQGGFICPEKKLIDTLYAPKSLNFSYKWFLGSQLLPNPDYYNRVNKTGVFKLEVTDDNGCHVSDTILVKIKCNPDTIIPIDSTPKEFKIPNVFTPNGDGINDYFEIALLEPNSKIEIFNRWGAIVFQSINYKNDWNADGINDGLYYFHLQSNNKNFAGWLQIIR